MNPYIRIENIRKTFSGIVANDSVSFEVNKGEIHTLLGENGAGKSTLMNVLTGLYSPDSGSIYVEGKEVSITSPAVALKYGIGMVHQHFMLVNNHTVFENIYLSLPDTGFFIKEKKLKKQVRDIISKFELDLDIDLPIWKLSIGEQQWLELIKLLIRDCSLLILDEPTAVLTPQEAERLFGFLNRLKKDGKSIIFISHKMREVMSLSDNVTILKKGKSIATLPKGTFDEEKLASLMIGDVQLPEIKKSKRKFEDIILKLENLNSINDKGIADLDDFSIEVYEGEILGIAGVAGNGQKALAEVVTGLKKPLSGRIIVKDIDITDSSSKNRYIAGIAHIPEDRKAMGIAPNMTVPENLILKDYQDTKFKKGIFQDKKAIKEHAQTLIKKFDIKVGPEGSPVRLLSGGNMQKVIIARELSGNPLILMALYPTRGLDVGSAEYVHKVIVDAREKGMSTVLISEDLDELFKLSDRIAVMFRGKNVGVVDAEKVTKTEIGLMMSGETLKNNSDNSVKT